MIWKRIALSLLFLTDVAFAFEDPTHGRAFLPWVWEEQLEPTIAQSTRDGNLSILAAGAVGSIAAYQYDDDVYQHNRRGENLLMSPDTAGALGIVGGGALGIGIAVSQIFVDQENGLRHGRAIALTSASHVTIAFLVARERPGGRGDYLPFKSSFPSGHGSHVFASATSLAYAYGSKVGVPAFAIATLVSAGRVSENAHWLSDVVAGAALGIFWGRASYGAPANGSEDSAVTWMPIPIDDGLILSAQLPF